MTSVEYSPDTLLAVSRTLSKVLRHEPGLVGVRLDASGWVDVQALVTKMNRAKRAAGAPKRLRTLPDLTSDLLRQVVNNNDKRRFALSDNGRLIRAVQGHSVVVDLGYPTVPPPPALFHGTAAENWKSISVKGLVPGARHAVHLSTDQESAKRVGARHGRPVVLEIQAGQMHQDGHRFSCADNGVWLVDSVPARYINLVSAL